MTDETTAPGCTLCELPTEGVDVTDDAGNEFCCRGCLDVYDTLGDLEDVDADDVRSRLDDAGSEPADVDDSTPNESLERTYLKVHGMYCATCEAFIESVAAELDGVRSVSVSYVTETVRIDHDPELTTADELREAISGLGYTAFPREDAFSERQANHMETVRVAVGVLVGMAVMLQYVAIIYPTYFGGLYYDERTTQFLMDAMAHGSGNYFFAIVGVLTTVILLVTGKPILQGAYVALRTRTPNMDLLVAIAAVSAYLYSTLAVIVVEQPHVYYDVTVAIVVVVTVGNYHEATLKRRATDRLSELTSVQVDEARRLRPDGSHDLVAVDELEVGDRLAARKGDRIPVDGTVVEGEAAVDESLITGESMPVAKRDGDRVIGGTVLTDGAITVSIDDQATSSLDRITELVWNVQSSNHGIQGLADRLATVFVPLVLSLAAVATVGYLVFGGSVAEALLVGLTVLIVSCPCALGLATPLAVAAGLRDALRRQIVVFDDTVFERLRGADTIVFDKTGTLTTGEMDVVASDLPGDLLDDAAILERRSAHPVGEAIAALADPDSTEADLATDGGQLNRRVDASMSDDGLTVESFESHDTGVSGLVDGRHVVVGHPDLFADLGWDLPEHLADSAREASEMGRVPVVVGRDGAARGLVVVGDELRDGWEETIRSLSERGIEVVVLTGDDERAAATFREHPAIDSVFAGVPPEGKAETVARLSDRGETVMIGDGTNDAPALARSDLGIALGGGTAMAVDAADVAIVDDDLQSVETVFELSAAAGTRIKQNLGWAFCYNGIAIPLALAGLLNPLFAAAAMATSSLLVVSNSSRRLVDDSDPSGESRS
ncbi:MAG: cation-translocating P-type ATPase [Natronomonas sp.]|jgi:Cu2+-exporting ATPase|uniref:heavy metal translocating P-type ATPase n=1 Tax=Natronomonas sp. TaxID=2184060 RepID=UPI0028704E43|nr:cation-translocating P-type ATPase [Natronomonas sp.]MDR9429335.1 cation-translocating P-type ATPase [Natronomonas sp.]